MSAKEIPGKPKKGGFMRIRVSGSFIYGGILGLAWYVTLMYLLEQFAPKTPAWLAVATVGYLSPGVITQILHHAFPGNGGAEGLIARALGPAVFCFCGAHVVGRPLLGPQRPGMDLWATFGEIVLGFVVGYLLLLFIDHKLGLYKPAPRNA